MRVEKRLEDLLPELDFNIIRELSLMAELDPSEEVKKSAKSALFRRYNGRIRGTYSQNDSIYVNILTGTLLQPYYVCPVENYELKIAEIEDDFFR